MIETDEWSVYFEHSNTNPPSDTAINALKELKNLKGEMIDLGCGAGVDALYFLENGWNVTAIDREIDFITNIREKMPEKLQKRFQIKKMLFEELKIQNAIDCICANYSLPFCNPSYFGVMWEAIVHSIKSGGIFSGVFFGDRDDWALNFPERTFHSKEHVIDMFNQFHIIDMMEDEYEGKCCNIHGNPIPKHWHIIRVIARKI
ncbi:class I SAM-dependent methyltransferase [Anaeromicropila herbilytica]|uniref:SAM-dependent methyltransferase n=1 Tax=Anaeromicropila herbilytica TaxID=2785025 RepID=A0A7R7EI05_9FIRM|nr:class I SAM-dependent methyltransferase [Anaeromicropila herbilytica]BCN29100.1 SAM-dependent methyltransferase [Anaeromicropila herbilytica]